MKRLHLRFYPYILPCILSAILAAAMSAISAIAFMRAEIGVGIGAALMTILFIVCIWLILLGGIVINNKKNRVRVLSREQLKVYAVDNVKEISISFEFDKQYMRWSAKVTIYLKNGKSANFGFTPYRWRFSKYGISLHNKERIEQQAKTCNLIKCYTAK